MRFSNFHLFTDGFNAPNLYQLKDLCKCSHPHKKSLESAHGVRKYSAQHFGDHQSCTFWHQCSLCRPPATPKTPKTPLHLLRYKILLTYYKKQGDAPVTAQIQRTYVHTYIRTSIRTSPSPLIHVTSEPLWFSRRRSEPVSKISDPPKSFRPGPVRPFPNSPPPPGPGNTPSEARGQKCHSCSGPAQQTGITPSRARLTRPDPPAGPSPPEPVPGPAPPPLAPPGRGPDPQALTCPAPRVARWIPLLQGYIPSNFQPLTPTLTPPNPPILVKPTPHHHRVAALTPKPSPARPPKWPVGFLISRATLSQIWAQFNQA